MLTKKLLRCQACRLKWFPNAGAAAACPACGSDQVGGTFELFHLGGGLIALAVLAWMTPIFAETKPGNASAPPTAESAIGERPQSPAAQTSSSDEHAPALPPWPAAQRAAAPLVGVIQAKKVTANVERGPARGQRVTFRRGDKVTILKREDRRFLVKDRRGNQVYVALNQVKPRPKAGSRREHVQR
jgi:hypothetical protein